MVRRKRPDHDAAYVKPLPRAHKAQPALCNSHSFQFLDARCGRVKLHRFRQLQRGFQPHVIVIRVRVKHFCIFRYPFGLYRHGIKCFMSKLRHAVFIHIQARVDQKAVLSVNHHKPRTAQPRRRAFTLANRIPPDGYTALRSFLHDEALRFVISLP